MHTTFPGRAIGAAQRSTLPASWTGNVGCRCRSPANVPGPPRAKNAVSKSPTRSVTSVTWVPTSTPGLSSPPGPNRTSFIVSRSLSLAVAGCRSMSLDVSRCHSLWLSAGERCHRDAGRAGTVAEDRPGEWLRTSLGRRQPLTRRGDEELVQLVAPEGQTGDQGDR